MCLLGARMKRVTLTKPKKSHAEKTSLGNFIIAMLRNPSVKRRIPGNETIMEGTPNAYAAFVEDLSADRKYSIRTRPFSLDFP